MAKRSSKRVDITLSQFKAWLSGVEDMQETGWCPNAKQWEMIRSKLFSIVESDSENVSFIPAERPIAEPTFQNQYPQIPYDPRVYSSSSGIDQDNLIPSETDSSKPSKFV